MKPFLFICHLMVAVTSLGQSSGNQLQFNGYGINLSIGNDGSLALTTEDGEVGLAGSMTGGWRRADPVSSEEIAWGTTVNAPCFFNKDTGFISGAIPAKSEKYDIIYRTTDGGKKWQAVKFWPDSYVINAAYNDKGEAWLSIARSDIAYTNDYGLTWEKFKTPNLKEWFSGIFFNTNSQGLIGSRQNVLYYTPNNCHTWKKLPTPLDQKKYNKTNRWSDPAFNRVAIFKDYLLVVQEDLVFYSKRDSINWIWLPDYKDLYTDANNSALFFQTNNDNYVRADDNFKPVHIFDVDGDDAKCKNGSLFIVGYREIVQLTPGDDTVRTLFNKANGIKEPEYIGHSEGGTIGYKDNKIFIQKEYNAPWNLLFTLPMQLEQKPELDLTNNDCLLYQRGDDSLFYFDLSGGLQKQTSKEAMLASFVKSNINQVFFSLSSFHAFENEWETIQYKNLGAEFGDTILTRSKETEVERKWLPENKNCIDAKDVSDFVSQLPALYNSTHMASLEDLGITENDYKQCKKDIQKFRESFSKGNKKSKRSEDGFDFNRNNLDFDRLLSLVDSIQQMDNKRIYKLLIHLRHSAGSRFVTRSIRFVNNNNEVLHIYSTYSGFPRAFYFPWYIEVNGCEVKSVDASIIRFIEKGYPGFLKSSPGKMELLYTLVKMLY